MRSRRQRRTWFSTRATASSPNPSTAVNASKSITRDSATWWPALRLDLDIGAATSMFGAGMLTRPLWLVNSRVRPSRVHRREPAANGITSGGDLNRVKFLNPLAQFPERNLLDLPDALARHAELFADCLQCFPVVTVQAKPLPEDGLLARIQCLDHFVDERVVRLFLELLVGRVRVFVFHDVRDMIGVIVADGRVERSRPHRGAA